jgi:hypothetical protein
MEGKKLFSLGSPVAYIATMDAGSFADLTLDLVRSNNDAIVRTVRGRKSETVFDFFDEISAALQFPYYFGENGDAFEECINDLDWIEGNAYLIAIPDADLFLSAASFEQFQGVMDILRRANQNWMKPNQYSPRDRPPTPFHLLCQCPAAESRLIARLKEAAIDFEVL